MSSEQDDLSNLPYKSIEHMITYEDKIWYRYLKLSGYSTRLSIKPKPLKLAVGSVCNGPDPRKKSEKPLQKRKNPSCPVMIKTSVNEKRVETM
ncbi:unnamed protein product, partial [Didymodactylos carnosus]